MITIRTHMALTALMWGMFGYVEHSLARLRDDEDGMITTETAVITVLLVGAAIVVVGIIYAAAKSNADAIPVPEPPAG